MLFHTCIFLLMLSCASGQTDVVSAFVSEIRSDDESRTTSLKKVFIDESESVNKLLNQISKQIEGSHTEDDGLMEKKRTTKDRVSSGMIVKEMRGRVALLKINAPLNINLIQELLDLLRNSDADPDVGAIVIIGGTADAFNDQDGIQESWLSSWTTFRAAKPIIGVVDGKSAGIGTELLMMCDILYASQHATLHLPDIFQPNAVMPGLRGIQRLIQAIGKPKAMEMMLIGSEMSWPGVTEEKGLLAGFAQHVGIVSQVFYENLLEEVMTRAHNIAGKSPQLNEMFLNAVKEASVSFPY